MTARIVSTLKIYFGREMLRKIKKLWSIIKYYFEDEDTLLLYLLKMKATECTNDCNKLEVRNTEELEDLIFHINTYIDIPFALTETKYPEFRNTSVRDVIKKFKDNKMSLKEIEKYGDFLIDIETHRAIERDLIFDHAKSLPFGCSL